MDRNRPNSILDDSPQGEPRDAWTRIRETVSADKHARRPSIAFSQVLWGLMAIVCLAAGIGGGFYLVKAYDFRGMLESTGLLSGTASKSAEKQESPKVKKVRGTRGRAAQESVEITQNGLNYNVEIVDNKTREDDFMAVAKDSDGRLFHVKPAPLPAVVIPHALPTATPSYGVAKQALPSPAVKALSVDEYRNLIGSVTLQASIGNDGAVKEYTVLDGPRELVQPALAVARAQRFDPPRKDYSARWTTITVNFKGQQ